MPEGSQIGWGYCRVSTNHQYDSTLGIRDQISIIIRYAEFKEIDLGSVITVEIGDQLIESRERIIIEAASSYRYSFRSRDGGRAIWDGSREGDHVIFSKVDRGFRDPEDCLKCCRLFKERGVIAHFCDINVDFSTSLGELMIGILSSVAKWESARRGERQAASHRERRTQGRSTYSTPPVGFMNVERDGVMYRQLNVDELALMQEFNQWHKDGTSVDDIALHVFRLGLKVPHWPQSAIDKHGEVYTHSRIRKCINEQKKIEDLLHRMDPGTPMTDAWSEWAGDSIDSEFLKGES